MLEIEEIIIIQNIVSTANIMIELRSKILAFFFVFELILFVLTIYSEIHAFLIDI